MSEREAVQSRPAATHWARLVHPEFRRLPPPIIVIGMHRSGTSLAAAMLDRLGVHLGENLILPPGEGAMPPGSDLRQRGYLEEHDFFSLNERFFYRSRSAWNDPDRLLHLRDQPHFLLAGMVDLLAATHGDLRRRFLPGLGSAARAWGWKDPRTSLTLPFWLRLFPGARVVHVRRNPANAARSLHRRAHEWLESPLPAAPEPPPMRIRRALLHPSAAIRHAGRKLGLVPPYVSPPDPCLSLGHCLKLTQIYVRECLAHRALGQAYTEVAYEDILAQPEAQADRLAAFAGTEPSANQLRAAVDLVWRSAPAEPVRTRGHGEGKLAQAAA